MENQITAEVKTLLKIKKVCLQEFCALLNHVNDPLIATRFQIRRLAEKLLGEKCSDKEKSIYAQMLSTLVQDFHNLKRDEVFPLGLAIIAKLALYLYLLNDKVADDKTMEKNLPALGLLISGRKYCWLSRQRANCVMEELEWLLKYAIVQTTSSKPDKVSLNKRFTFEDFNIGEIERMFIAKELEEYIGAGEILKTIPDYDDTISDYSEKAYKDLFC